MLYNNFWIYRASSLSNPFQELTQNLSIIYNTNMKSLQSGWNKVPYVFTVYPPLCDHVYADKYNLNEVVITEVSELDSMRPQCSLINK